VLEGSTLGGAVLARTLGPRLDFSATHGMAYWNAYGDNVGPRWRTFLTALDMWATSCSHAQRHEIVTTACATFEAFITTFKSASTSLLTSD